MSNVQLGELMALGTALCWTVSALSFESASRRAGSLPVNFVRLCIAFIGLTLVGLLGPRHRLIPTDAPTDAWNWLLISGVVGFFIGDLALFRAFVEMGARLSTLMQSLAPLLAAIATYMFVPNLQMTSRAWLGMFVTLAGIAWVVAERSEMNASPGRVARHATMKGLALGFIGAAGQGIGMVLTARGLEHFKNPYAATQIRAIAGLAGFALLIVCLRDVKRVGQTIRNPHALMMLTLGAIAGPLVGVSLIVNSMAHDVSPGVAQTLASLVPVTIIPVLVLMGRERITWRAVAGSIVAVAGVGILLWKQ